MKNIVFSLFLLVVLVAPATGQDLPADINGYHFTPVKKMDAMPVQNQFKSSTCWVYSTNSFLESELIRLGKTPVDLSEMYVVRAAYIKKAENYIRRQGAAAFSQGAENHDVMNLVREYGIVPHAVYSGMPAGQDKPVHGEMEAVLKGIVEAVHKMPDGKLSKQWKSAFTGALDGYMGAPPANFQWEGKTYTPQTYFQSLGIKPDDYVALTSYNHHPFYKPFVLEVSDNWSNGMFYNVTIDELVQAAEHAVTTGYTIAWATDVSEKTFSAKEGLAIMPDKAWDDMSQGARDSLWKAPVKEKWVTQEERQQAFDELSTTDDHGMHITGLVTDQAGTKYFTVKNSWGTVKKEMAGYLYVSQPYFRYKTMAIMVHKDALPKALRQKLGL
ncbi:MAG TPA: C1 family peptidase [Saprospiraceae bacterium]|nr:C1 family peptidase [Saprospiraceae bacterium]